jgi:hypothetical protein
MVGPREGKGDAGGSDRAVTDLVPRRTFERMAARAKGSGTLLCLLLCLSLLPAAFGQQKAKDQSYEALAARVTSGDKTVDFRQLRLAYAESANYSKGPDTDPQKKEMTSALNAKDYARAIKSADVVLAANYVDMDAHYVEYVAHKELGKTEPSEFHKFVLQGLLRSITDSGDGKSPETAYQVIEVHEEYVLLRFMGVGLPKSQAYLHKDGHAYDEIKFDDPSSKTEKTLYFNVDIPAKHGL